MGVCFGLIAYVSVNQHYDLAALEQSQESSQQAQPSGQRTTPLSSSKDTKTVTLRVTGPSGERFSGYVNTLDGTRSLDGSTPVDYKVEVRADPLVADFLYATIQKAVEDDKDLNLQILEDGRVVREGSTSAAHEGVVSLIWNPEERPAEDTSTRVTTQEGTQEKSLQGSTSTQPLEKAAPAGSPNNAP